MFLPFLFSHLPRLSINPSTNTSFIVQLVPITADLTQRVACVMQIERQFMESSCVGNHFIEQDGPFTLFEIDRFLVQIIYMFLHTTLFSRGN